MVKFVKIMAASDDNYRKNAAKWTKDSTEVKAVAKWSGAKPEDVPARHGALQVPAGLGAGDEAWLGGGANSTAAKALRGDSDVPLSQKQIEKTAARLLGRGQSELRRRSREIVVIASRRDAITRRVRASASRRSTRRFC